MPKIPYPYEINGNLVTENGSLTPICTLSKLFLSQSLTISLQITYDHYGRFQLVNIYKGCYRSHDLL